MTASIRILTPGEAALYVALRKEMLLESPRSFGASPETDVASDLVGLRSRLENQGVNRTFGAFDRATGELLGVVGGGKQGPHKKRAHAFSVWGMYVTPKARGRGLARKLMQALIDYSRTVNGVCLVCLSVGETAPVAQGLYESLGFVEWGREPLSLQIDGEFFTEIFMQLQLGPDR
jgi:L-amino acid N-acyltransferase YncA